MSEPALTIESIAKDRPLLGAPNLDWILDYDSGRYYLKSELELSLSASSQGDKITTPWRLTERLRTVGIGIGLCLNLGTDPPDSDRVAPCARTECGVDPTAYGDTPPFTVLKLIGHNLEEQFRSWQPRARIKLVADPTVEMIRKMCVSLRKQSKDERIVIHFNGHGVPKPTSNGEIWVYNEDFTQYIPLASWDLCRWAGFPALFTFDCSGAGNLLRHFLEQDHENEKRYKNAVDEYLRAEARYNKECERRAQREREAELLRRQAGHAPLPPSPALAAESLPPPNVVLQKPVRKSCMVLLPCDADEVLPSSPDLPADLFTCCLTTPIQVALRWFILQNAVTMEPLGIEPGMATLVPGKVSDRRSMLGELNWVFTAVTDSIAWSVLSREQFQALFRHDPLIASMLRNFLLAERIFKSLGCTPSSLPALPSTWRHPMWDAWDQAVEHALMQLPSVLTPEALTAAGYHKAAKLARQETGGIKRAQEHEESTFFKDQLQAFESWLAHPSPPRVIDQLPVILQVLLTRQHRYLALDQLARFLDIGTWAVVQALGVGIFPYMLKLLQTPLPNLRHALVRIWARIIAHDPSVRADLVNAKAFGYFKRQIEAVGDPDHAVRATVVLAFACHGDAQCQARFFASDVDQACLNLLPLAGVVNAGSEDTESDGETTSSKTSESDHGTGNGGAHGDGNGGLPLALKPSAAPPSPLASLSADLVALGGEAAASSPRLALDFAVRHPLLCKWVCLTLANLWDGHEPSRVRAISLDAPNRIAELLRHPDAELREAAVHAIGSLFGPSNDPNAKPKSQEVCNFECEQCLRLLRARSDGSGAVRREIVFAVARFVTDVSTHYGPILLTVQALSEYRQRREDGVEASKEMLMRNVGPRGFKYLSIWIDVSRALSADPFPAVSQAAQVLSRVVRQAVDARIDAIRVRVSGAPSSAAAAAVDDDIDLDALGLRSMLFKRLSAEINQSSVELEEAEAAAHVAALTREQARAEGELRRAALGKEIARWAGLTPALGAMSASSSFDRGSRARELAAMRAAAAADDHHYFGTAATVAGSGSMGSGGGGGSGGSGGGGGGTSGGAGVASVEPIFETLPYKYLGPLLRDRGLPANVSSSTLLQSHRSAARSPAVLRRQRSMDKQHAVDFVSRVESAKGQLPARTMTLHPSLPLLITADSRDCVSAYDFSDAARPRQISRFSNKNLARTTINSMTWVGEGDDAVLVASDDGNVRVWRDPCSVSTRIVSAFAAFGDVSGSRYAGAPGERNYPLIVDWQAACGHVNCAWAQFPDTTSKVRVWDLNAEAVACEFQVGPGQIVGLCSSPSEFGSSLMIIGYADGSLRICDKRDASGASTAVAFSREHTDPLLSMRVSGDYSLVTGTTMGEVRVWDVRRPFGPMQSSVQSFSVNRALPDPVDALAIHASAPVLACSPHKQPVVSVFSTEGAELCQVKLQPQGFVGGFMGTSRLLRVQAVACHKDELAFAVATDDNALSVYAARLRLASVWVGSSGEDHGTDE